MTGRGAREKGAVFERDVRDLARAHGFKDARRTFQQGPQGGADLVNVSGLSVECKRQETVRLREWWQQAVDAAGRDTPCVALRWNRGPALGVIELDELFALWALKVRA